MCTSRRRVLTSAITLLLLGLGGARLGGRRRETSPEACLLAVVFSVCHYQVLPPRGARNSDHDHALLVAPALLARPHSRVSVSVVAVNRGVSVSAVAIKPLSSPKKQIQNSKRLVSLG
eukprot:1555726-Rhodomonas_salina.1